MQGKHVASTHRVLPALEAGGDGTVIVGASGGIARAIHTAAGLRRIETGLVRGPLVAFEAVLGLLFLALAAVTLLIAAIDWMS